MAKDTTGRLHVTVKSAGKRKLSSKLWLERQLNDPLRGAGQARRFRSRAAYKLQEIDDAPLPEKGQVVVDSGAAPGGWSQIAAQRVGSPRAGQSHRHRSSGDGRNSRRDFAQMDFQRGRARQIARDDRRRRGCCDVGHGGEHDGPSQDGSVAHCRTRGGGCGLRIEVLNPGGVFLAKVFQSGADAELLAQLKRDFTSVKHVKLPQAARIRRSVTCWRRVFGVGRNSCWCSRRGALATEAISIVLDCSLRSQ